MTLFEQLRNLYQNYISLCIDVCLIAFLLYQVYRIIEKTHSFQLLKGAIVILLVYSLTIFLNLSTLRWVFERLAVGIVVAIAIVYQPELRRIFLQIGQSTFTFSSKEITKILDPVLDAAQELSQLRCGMLVVFLRHDKLEERKETGTVLDAVISSSLLLTIFRFETALHDAAVLIQDNRIVAAGCFLNLSERQDIKKTLGTRHRAALGTAESSDAVVLVVSEETGAMSLAYDSKLYYDLSREQIREVLKKELNLKEDVSAKDGNNGRE